MYEAEEPDPPMLDRLGHRVQKLKRIAIGPIAIAR